MKWHLPSTVYNEVIKNCCFLWIIVNLLKNVLGTKGQVSDHDIIQADPPMTSSKLIHQCHCPSWPYNVIVQSFNDFELFRLTLFAYIVLFFNIKRSKPCLHHIYFFTRYFFCVSKINQIIPWVHTLTKYLFIFEIENFS